MYRIDNATAAVALPAPAAVGPKPNAFYTKGNPGGGTPATIVDDDALNAMQEEICAVIEGAGITLSKTDRTQLLQAIRGGGGNYLTDTGAANAYVVTPTKPFASYYGGMTIVFIPANANTTTSTINVSGLGVKNIVYSNGDNLRPGDIKASGLHTIKYQATLGKFVLEAPGTPAYVTNSGAGYFRIPGTPFILQWVLTTSPAGAGSSVSMPGGMNWYNQGSPTWPVTFPNGILWCYGSPETTNDTYFWLFQGNRSTGGWNNLFITRNTNAITMFATPLYLFALGW